MPEIVCSAEAAPTGSLVRSLTLLVSSAAVQIFLRLNDLPREELPGDCRYLPDRKLMAGRLTGAAFLIERLDQQQDLVYTTGIKSVERLVHHHQIRL